MNSDNVTTARPIPAAPGFFASGVRIFDLSLGEMLWSRRTIFMMLVAGAPIVIACFLRIIVMFGAPVFEEHRSTQGGVTQTIRMTGPAIFGLMIWIFYLRFTVPVLGVFYGTSLMADEVEDKTITYLFTRPIRRGAVLFGKYLAYLGCTVFVVLPSVTLVYLLVVPMRGSLGASFIVLSLHWGANMVERPPRPFRRFARAALDRGVDMIHGHSAHIFQGVEVHHGKPILYDTGEALDDYAIDPVLRNDRSFIILADLEDARVRALRLVPILLRGTQVGLARGRDFEETCRRMQMLSAEMGTRARPGPHGLTIGIPAAGV